MTTKELLSKNELRYEYLKAKYSPMTGEGAYGERRALCLSDHPIPIQYIPVEMFKNNLISRLSKCKSIASFASKYLKSKLDNELLDIILLDIQIVRFKYDFVYWAYVDCKIKNKDGGDMIPFKLNRAQLILLDSYETQRKLMKPIRIILAKSRQWGGSTLTQIYMGWIQLFHKKAWYSTIVAQNSTVSARILEMYNKMLAEASPESFDLSSSDALRLTQYGRTKNDYTVMSKSGSRVRDIVIQIGTVENPDGIRGGDCAMAHYSEVASWKDTPGMRPEDLMRSVSGGISLRPYTIEVIESSPKGTGNFFHREYMRARNGESLYKAVYIPFFYIMNDTMPLNDQQLKESAEWLLKVKDMETLPDGCLDEGRYYWRMWTLGCTLQGIEWYKLKRLGVSDHSLMASEASIDDIEAFQNSGNREFDIYDIDIIRTTCRGPICVGIMVGQSDNPLIDAHFVEKSTGPLKIWTKPESNNSILNRYLVVVDIGGRRRGSDYSVMAVFDRFPMVLGGRPEIVAEYRGHDHHDKIAWQAAMLAQYYDNALLVIESNTLETKDKQRDVDGNTFEYILDIVSSVYENLYAREKSAENIKDAKVTKWGFHTNVHTKPAIISHLGDCVRDRAWVERNTIACDELSYYEKRKDGSYGAIEGQHDDVLMTRAIGLWICFRDMDMPKEKIKVTPRNRDTSNNNESRII